MGGVGRGRMAAATGGFLLPTAVGGAALVFKPLSALLFMFHVKHRGALILCLECVGLVLL